MNVLCQSNKLPAEHLSLDESMIRFKGRSSLNNITPRKQSRKGTNYGVWLTMMAMCIVLIITPEKKILMQTL